MIMLEGDQLVFRFGEVHEAAECRVIRQFVAMPLGRMWQHIYEDEGQAERRNAAVGERVGGAVEPCPTRVRPAPRPRSEPVRCRSGGTCEGFARKTGASVPGGISLR